MEKEKAELHSAHTLTIEQPGPKSSRLVSLCRKKSIYTKLQTNDELIKHILAVSGMNWTSQSSSSMCQRNRSAQLTLQAPFFITTSHLFQLNQNMKKFDCKV